MQKLFRKKQKTNEKTISNIIEKHKKKPIEKPIEIEQEKPIMQEQKTNEKSIDEQAKELIDKGAFDFVDEMNNYKKKPTSTNDLQKELETQKTIINDLTEQIEFLKLQTKYNNLKTSSKKDTPNKSKSKSKSKSKKANNIMQQLEYRANNKLLLWALFNPIFMAIGMILLGIGNSLLLGAYIMLWVSYAVFNTIRCLGKMIYSII